MTHRGEKTIHCLQCHFATCTVTFKAILNCLVTKALQCHKVLVMTDGSKISCPSLKPGNSFPNLNFEERKTSFCFPYWGLGLGLPCALHSPPTELYHKALKRPCSQCYNCEVCNLTSPSHHDHLKTNSIV